MKLKIKKFESFKDKTGFLRPFYNNSHFKNFKLRRFFLLYGNKKYPRADHAHKKCNQILIPVEGLIQVEITKKNKKKIKFILSVKNKRFLTVPTFHWIKIKFKNSKSILLTLCDYKYDKREYIQNFEDFIKTKG